MKPPSIAVGIMLARSLSPSFRVELVPGMSIGHTIAAPSLLVLSLQYDYGCSRDEIEERISCGRIMAFSMLPSFLEASWVHRKIITAHAWLLLVVTCGDCPDLRDRVQSNSRRAFSLFGREQTATKLLALGLSHHEVLEWTLENECPTN